MAPPQTQEEKVREANEKKSRARAAASRVSDTGDALRLHKDVLARLAAAVPVLRAASDAVLAAGQKDHIPDPVGHVLRDAARRIQAAVSAWNDYEETSEAKSEDERKARDKASDLIKDAMSILAGAAGSQVELEKSTQRNVSNRAARSHHRLRVRELGKALAGSTALISRLLRTLSLESNARHADLLETVSNPDHPG